MEGEPRHRFYGEKSPAQPLPGPAELVPDEDCDVEAAISGIDVDIDGPGAEAT
jgi:hypothetical protein